MMLELLKAQQFKAVICIDDENAIPRPDNVESFADALVNAKPRKRRNLVTNDNGFAECCAMAEDAAEADDEARKANVRAKLNEMAAKEELTAERMANAAAVLYQGYAGKTQAKLKEIFQDDHVTFSAFSFAEWQERGEQVLQSARPDSRVLLLVDERNDLEPAIDLDGHKLLANVLARGDRAQNIDAVVVTSNCVPETELDESHTVYEAISALLKARDIDPSFKKIFVLSKDRLEQADLKGSFVFHLNRIEASRLSIALADATKEVLGKALSDSLDWLKQVPLMEFHNSIFVTARNEGAAEIDTLVRLASIRQRAALEKLLREDQQVQKYIEAMRRFDSDEFGGPLPSASNSALRKLREEEFERPSDHINLLRAPLACGDVFEIRTGVGERQVVVHAMLLVNPCDLMLRNDGTRKLTTGLLVQVRKIPNTEADQIVQQERASSPLLYRLSTGKQGDDYAYLFTNSKIEAMPLAVLDLCWTNERGAAELIPSEILAAWNALSPAQKARVNTLVGRAASANFMRVELWNSELIPILTDDAPVDVNGQQADKRVIYSAKRIWRLAPEFAAASLSALSQALARPAFGHDYLQQ